MRESVRLVALASASAGLCAALGCGSSEGNASLAESQPRDPTSGAGNTSAGNAGTSSSAGSTSEGGTAGQSDATAGGAGAATAGSGGDGGDGGETATAGSAGDSSGGDGGSAGTATGGDSSGGSAGNAGAGGGTNPNCPIAIDATLSATLRITVDNSYRLFVNGALIDDTAYAWTNPQVYQIQLLRHPGQTNVIAIEGINGTGVNGLDRAAIAELTFDAGAGNQVLVTDDSWRASATLAANWFDVDFNDANWATAVDVGAHGVAPWGPVLGISPAHWIWSYYANADADEKPEGEINWFRREFSIDNDGELRDNPSDCP